MFKVEGSRLKVEGLKVKSVIPGRKGMAL